MTRSAPTGFATDPARVRHAQDKPRVERVVQYVRGNFFAGEEFVDLADAQAHAEKWCRDVAGRRMHGTLQARPAEVFAEYELGALLPVPDAYDVPIFTRVKAHRDFHIEIGKALYSAPKAYLGQHLDVRADTTLVKLFCRRQLVKVHPRQQPGGRWTDPEDLPAEKTAYALRDLHRLIAAARRHGEDVGIYDKRLLDDKLPWTRMRQVYGWLAWPAATATSQSTPPAAGRWSSTSSPSPRSHRCWNRPPRTPPPRSRRRWPPARPGSLAIRPSSAESNPPG